MRECILVLLMDWLQQGSCIKIRIMIVDMQSYDE